MAVRERHVFRQIELLNAVHPLDGLFELREVGQRRIGRQQLRGHERRHPLDGDGADEMITLDLARLVRSTAIVALRTTPSRRVDAEHLGIEPIFDARAPQVLELL